MLVTNQWLDKLAVAQVDYSKRGMLQGPLLHIGAAANDHVIPDSDDPDDASGQSAVEEPPEATTFDIQLAYRHGMSEHVSHKLKKTDSLVCSTRPATFGSRGSDALRLQQVGAKHLPLPVQPAQSQC